MSIASIIVFLPLIAAIFVGLNSKTISDKRAGVFTSGAVLISAFFALITFYQVVLSDENHDKIIHISKWFSSGQLYVDWALKIDVLSSSMMVLVTVVSALVHLYSIGYMKDDENFPRFMSYLSLFTFFMLILVTADNFVQLFVGWEGVGLASYLLIGFWYKKDSANNAAMKAFIVNRVGDFGLAIGIFLCFVVFDSVRFDAIFVEAQNNKDSIIEFLGYEIHAITLICVFLFVGCMGKSAQFLLHTWLPDAMEGPTPVSALIHAATMVTAGVFLVARCSPLFEYSLFAKELVLVFGAFTAFFAATIALTQNDIKKVIAYSTCSQLGYMFAACGVGAYSAGVFHLLTHGFFKALLFLGAGSVIHAMHHEQDLRLMGGLRKKIPLTFLMMLIGTLAITGFPLFSGYFSKDLIIEAVYAGGEAGGGTFGNLAFVSYILLMITVFLTAFYSWRLIFMTFFGEHKLGHESYEHLHESPKIMLYPLYILAFGAVFAGAYLMFGAGIAESSLNYWKGAITILSVGSEPHNNIIEQAHHVPSFVKILPLVLALLGFLLALLMYSIKIGLAEKIAGLIKPLYNFSLNKWYIDELYDALFVKNAKRLANLFWKVIDISIIDRFGPNGVARFSANIAGRVSRLQTGFIFSYGFWMIFGVALVISIALKLPIINWLQINL